MKWLINFFRGTLNLCVVGSFPERLLNLCGQERIDFWAVEFIDACTICFTIRCGSFGRVKELAERIGCEVEKQGSWGFPDYFVRFKKRYAFLIGLAVCLWAVSFLSCFILQIEVTGNQQVSTAVILNQLRKMGVKPGVYGPKIDRQQIAQQMLLEMEDLSWMGINLSGTKLQVSVREREKKPDRIDENEFVHIVAETDGVIVRVEPELGDATVQSGDTVTKGDILISGTVTLEPPQYSDLPNRYYQKHARGRVWARTWRTVRAIIPTQMQGKEYTGTNQTAWNVNFFGHSIEILGNSSISWPFYDKIASAWQVQLPGAGTIPVWITKENCMEYTPVTLSLELEEGQKLLEEHLKQRILETVEDGKIQDLMYTAQVKNGLLSVTALAECYEEIGEERPGW